MMAPQVNTVEYQGLHGAVTVSERVVQKIWQRRDFRQEGLVTLAGRRVNVRQPGRWNRQEGPDFREAEISLDGEVSRGDVEIHFYPQDWFLHGHDRDPHFDRVALHVCLFPPRQRYQPATTGGRLPETLVLLGYLNQDLESYAADDALAALEQRERPDLLQLLLAETPEARLTALYERAALRWRQKVAFARQRLSKTDWAQACHQLALEVLGYRRNRGPMAMLAARFPLAVFAGQEAGALYRQMEGSWRLAGLRPANHPRKRLAQYLTVLGHDPAWPETLLAWADACGLADRREPRTASLRKGTLAAARQALAERVLGDALGGSRLDTLVIDACLPLLAAKTGRDYFPAWFHWWAGDMPARLAGLLREAEVLGPRRPAANGWFQGGLQLLLESGL